MFGKSFKLDNDKFSLLKEPVENDIEPGASNQRYHIIEYQLISNMNVPLSVELRVSLNFPVSFELRKDEFNQLDQGSGGVRILIKVDPDQQNDQNHVDQINKKNVNDQKPVLFCRSSMPPVIHQRVSDVIENQVYRQDQS